MNWWPLLEERRRLDLLARIPGPDRDARREWAVPHDTTQVMLFENRSLSGCLGQPIKTIIQRTRSSVFAMPIEPFGLVVPGLFPIAKWEATGLRSRFHARYRGFVFRHT